MERGGRVGEVKMEVVALRDEVGLFREVSASRDEGMVV